MPYRTLKEVEAENLVLLDKLEAIREDLDDFLGDQDDDEAGDDDDSEDAVYEVADHA